MSLPPEDLAEKVQRLGPCRSQRDGGRAVVTACTLWNGHEGLHLRAGVTWTDADGYLPSPAEIRALEEVESEQVATELEVKPIARRK